MRSRSASFFLLAILILASLTGADSTGPCSQSLTGAFPPCCTALANSQGNFVISGTLIGVSFLALIVSINIVAVGYIISKLFPTAGVRNWVNEEMLEIAKSAILIVAIFSVLTLMGNIATVLSPAAQQFVVPGPTVTYSNYVYGLSQGACGYLANVQGELTNSFNYLLTFGDAIGALKSFTVAAYVPIPIGTAVVLENGFSYNPYVNSLFESEPTTGAYESVLNDAISFAAFPITALIFAQEYLLPLITAIGLVVLIPLGLVLRALPFVRGIGGTLIAFGIGAAIVYPSVLVLVNLPVTNAFQFGAYSTISPNTCSSNFVVCWLENIFSPLISGSSTNQGFGDAIGAFANYSMYPGMNGIMYYVTYISVQFILFIIDLFIAFPIVDSIARALGGSITLSLGGKFRLV